MQFTDQLLVGLLEAAPDAVVCVDAGGRILLVNAQTERLFGYGREELVGQPVEILVPDAIKAGHPAHRAGYMADPQPRQMGAVTELAGRHRDGSTFPADTSLSAIDSGEGILVSAAVRDVSERLELQAERERLKTWADRDRLERQLHQSQHLESLGQLAGGVAHDFNNLLAVISNYATFVAEEVASKAPQQEWQAVREDIQQIQRAAERAAGLTHQLLAFARRDVIQPRALPQPRHRRDRAAAAAHPGRARGTVHRSGRRATTCAGRPGPDRAGPGQPGRQRPRRDARRREADRRHRQRECRRGPCRQPRGYVQVYSLGLGTTLTILLPETSQAAEEP